MTATLAWIASTKADRWVASLAAATAIAAAVLLRVYGAGKDAEAAKQADENLESLRSRNRTDEVVDQIGDAARRDELARWVRDDGR